MDAGLPGVERLATVLDNILSGRVLQRPVWAGAAELGLILLLPALAAAAIGRWALLPATLAGMALLLLLLGLAQWGFERH